MMHYSGTVAPIQIKQAESNINLAKFPRTGQNFLLLSPFLNVKRCQINTAAKLFCFIQN